MNTKFFIYLNLGVAGLQIVAFVMTGSWFNAFVFIYNYTFAWKMYRQYKHEKAKEWYTSILAAQERARFPQRMKGCGGWCSSRDDYVNTPGSARFVCKYCGLFEP